MGLVALFMAMQLRYTYTRGRVASVILIYREPTHTDVYVDYSSVPIIIDIVCRFGAAYEIAWNSACPAACIFIIDATRTNLRGKLIDPRSNPASPRKYLAIRLFAISFLRGKYIGASFARITSNQFDFPFRERLKNASGTSCVVSAVYRWTFSDIVRSLIIRNNKCRVDCLVGNLRSLSPISLTFARTDYPFDYSAARDYSRSWNTIPINRLT